MKGILDTNIFVSGIHWSGDSEKILYAWFDNKFEVICSIEIIYEIIKTLMNFKVTMSLNDILLWIMILIGKSIIVEPTEKIDIIKEDIEDNKFIEAAIAGNVDYIVTQDNHLLKIKEFRGIRILTPQEFLEIIKP